MPTRPRQRLGGAARGNTIRSARGRVTPTHARPVVQFRDDRVTRRLGLKAQQFCTDTANWSRTARTGNAGRQAPVAAWAARTSRGRGGGSIQATVRLTLPENAPRSWRSLSSRSGGRGSTGMDIHRSRPGEILEQAEPQHHETCPPSRRVKEDEGYQKFSGTVQKQCSQIPDFTVPNPSDRTFDHLSSTSSPSREWVIGSQRRVPPQTSGSMFGWHGVVSERVDKERRGLGAVRRWQRLCQAAKAGAWACETWHRSGRRTRARA